MGFLNCMKINVKKWYYYSKDYLTSIVKFYCVLKPYLKEAKKDLKQLELIKIDVPNNVYIATNKIRKNNCFKKEIIQFDDLINTIESHNEKVNLIKSNFDDFSLDKILIEIDNYTEDDINNIYEISKLISEFSNVPKNLLNIQNECKELYLNLNVIIKQHNFFKLQEKLYSQLNSSKYIDANYKRTVLGNISNGEKELGNHKKYYNFKSLNEFESRINYLNEMYIKQNINNKIFDDVLGKKLDNNQRTAVLTDEIQELVVAGAGCGKTLTICGKVKYLLDHDKINPDDVLLLTFSKESQKDLEGKINLISKKIKTKTFHSLGLEILNDYYNLKMNVDDQYNHIIDEYFKKHIFENKKELKEVLWFYSLYFQSSNQLKDDYKTEGDLFKDLKANDMTTLKDICLRNGGRKETFKKELVKSYEELAIANFYFLNGINYIYEDNYEYSTATNEKRQYRPDFHIINGAHNFYHEHYGVDKNGMAKQYSFEENKLYREGMEWKRRIHKENNTICIETYSYEFQDGTIFDNLTKKLNDNGIQLTPITDEKLYDTLNSIINNRDFKSLIKLFYSFISLYKAKYDNEEYFKMLIDNYKFDSLLDHLVAVEFIKICKNIYRYYKNYLNQQDRIDFDDMILKAIKILPETNEFKYKYIIVDEFQDISHSRMDFLKALINHGNSKLFVVGDDWQSIYRFAGCDVSLFTKFQNNFPDSKIGRITTTFRNSQELQEVVEPFITKNPEQLKKHIQSSKHLSFPVIINYYDGENDKKNEFEFLLDWIYEIQKDAKVLVLMRNNMDLESVLTSSLKRKSGTLEYLKHPELEIYYKTVHGSKGLESDYVILINGEDNKYGFPNKIEDDKLLSMVLDEKSSFLYGEERRLFYVALTRTKNKVFVMAPISNPSEFVEEIKENAYCRFSDLCVNNKVIKCPKCKSGRLELKESFGKKFFGCSNYPYCEYTNNHINDVIKNKRCPICGNFLVKRVSKFNKQWFYGCSSFPNCNYTEPYD